jgi:hypothetical protein
MVLDHLMAVPRVHLMEDTARHTQAVAELVALKAQENGNRIAGSLAGAVDVVDSVAQKVVEVDSLAPRVALEVDSLGQVAPTEALDLHTAAALEEGTFGVKALAAGLGIAGDIVVETSMNRGAPHSHGAL